MVATYTGNGRPETLTDGEGNKTSYVYDGHDRLSQTRMPSPSTDGVSSTTDYEELGYDANGNVTSRRLRDGNSIAFTYDALNRPTLKNLPGSEPDVTYAYDLLGRLTGASTSVQGEVFSYDALGRNLMQSGGNGTSYASYDAAGRRTRLTYPGTGLYVDYDYLVTGEVTHLRENGATSGVGVLATYAYDQLGRRTSLTRGNGSVTSYDFDPVSRLDELAQNLSGTSNDLTLGFSHNPGGQIVSNTRSNDSYSFTGLSTQNVTDTHNGLNQLTATGGTSVSHDARGNVSAIGSSSYGYSSENLLRTGPGGVTLSYDPLQRLYEADSPSGTTRFGYDGQALIAEYGPNGNLLRRYVHGPGVDEPLVQYEGTGTSDRRFLHADERGSIVAVSDSSGALSGGLNRYDAYGAPQGTMNGRFGYTGQAWLPELSLWYYKARMYDPRGRFMQTDPIGYGAGMNLHGYVGGDPINFTDPNGLTPITVTGVRPRRRPQPYVGVSPVGASAIGFGDGGGSNLDGEGAEIVVTAQLVSQRSQRRMTLGRPLPTRVIVQPSCANVPAALAFNVQQAALEAFRRSALSGSEHAVFAFPTIIIPGFFGVGDIFTSNDARFVSSESINRNTPSASGAVLRGYSPIPALLIHAHPNNQPPSPLNRDDQRAADQRGYRIAAIDWQGNLTCSN